MAIKYINIFQSRALQNLPKLGFLVRKETIWQPCFVASYETTPIHSYFRVNVRLIATSEQGCQMVYFRTKNPNLGKFWRALDWKVLIYLMANWNSLWALGIFWSILCSFGTLDTFFRFGYHAPSKILQPCIWVSVWFPKPNGVLYVRLHFLTESFH
jgi:hypothetical protein